MSARSPQSSSCSTSASEGSVFAIASVKAPIAT
jgi:hypothetical protein